MRSTSVLGLASLITLSLGGTAACSSTSERASSFALEGEDAAAGGAAGRTGAGASEAEEDNEETESQPAETAPADTADDGGADGAAPDEPDEPSAETDAGTPPDAEAPIVPDAGSTPIVVDDPPYVVNVSPNPSTPVIDRKITVEFSEPMDQQSVSAAITGYLAYDVTWNEAGTEVSFQFDNYFAESEVILEYTIAASAKDLEGTPMGADYPSSIKLAPYKTEKLGLTQAGHYAGASYSWLVAGEYANGTPAYGGVTFDTSALPDVGPTIVPYEAVVYWCVHAVYGQPMLPIYIDQFNYGADMSKLADDTNLVKELGPMVTWLGGPNTCEVFYFHQDFADIWTNRGDNKTLQMRLRSESTPTATQDTVRFRRWDNGTDEDIPDQTDAFSIVVRYFDLAAQ